jgi:hypothetical protein
MFVLSKWYCDCVSDEGVAFIGYWARMQWGLLKVPYAATLYKPLRDATRERYSIRPSAAPTIQDDELRWDCRRLGIGAVWTARAPAVHRTLLETAEGSITWHCHLPCALARVNLAGTGRFSGLGYAEQLTMSAKPWRLPFEELRWGRFLSGIAAVGISQRSGATRRDHRCGTHRVAERCRRRRVAGRRRAPRGAIGVHSASRGSGRTRVAAWWDQERV